MMEGVSEPFRISACPLSPDCGWHPDYPEDYQDPPWVPTGNMQADEKSFGAIVISARSEAIKRVLNDHLASHSLDLRFEWGPGSLRRVTPGQIDS